MITVSVEVRTNTSTRTVKVSAPAIRRALKLAVEGSPGTQARVLFPIDLDEFFAGPNEASGTLPASTTIEAAV